MGDDGIPQAACFGAATPTIPGLDNRLDRFAPRHAGHDGTRSAVTNISNCLLQSRHSYSKMGMGK